MRIRCSPGCLHRQCQGRGNGYLVSTYSLPDSVSAPGRRSGGLYLPRQDFGWGLCPVRWRDLLHQHRGAVFSRFRTALGERPDHLLLPDHRGPSEDSKAGISNRRPLSLAEIVLRELQESDGQREDRLDDLRRRSNRHRPPSDLPRHRNQPSHERAPLAARFERWRGISTGWGLQIGWIWVSRHVKRGAGLDWVIALTTKTTKPFAKLFVTMSPRVDLTCLLVST